MIRAWRAWQERRAKRRLERTRRRIKECNCFFCHGREDV